MNRLVLFVEGEGEATAAPALIGRLLNESAAWDLLHLDPQPFRVGQVNKLLKDGFREWHRKLGAARKRRNVGGVLLLLDGDVAVNGQRLCPATVARELAREARKAGAGSVFSVAVVFAMQEYESWLIAGIETMGGKRLPDGRLINHANVSMPDGDLEENPRNAKGWLGDVIEGGYKPTRDQAGLTQVADLGAIRRRQMRSFRRLESAVAEMVDAFRSGICIVSPPPR